MGRKNNLNSTTKQVSKLVEKNASFLSHPKGLSIKYKVILTAIAISIIPTSLLGISTYLIAKHTANQEIIKAQEQVARTQLFLTQSLAEQFSQFLQIRFEEIEVLAKNPILTNPNLWESTTLEQKQEILNSFHARSQFYDEVIFLDVKGNPLFHSESNQRSPINYSDREYFQQAIVSKQIFVTEPILNTTTGKLGIEYIAPVINAWTGEIKGLIYIFLSERAISQNFSDYTDNNQDWYFIDSQGVFFAGAKEKYINSKAQRFFPDIGNLYRTRSNSSGIYTKLPENNQQLLSYAPVTTQGFYPDKYLGVVVTTEAFPSSIALTTGSWILVLGIIITALIIGLAAAYIAKNFTKELVNSIKAIELIGRGKLNTRIPIRGKDELAVLGAKINQMAEKLMYSIERQTMLAKMSELRARITRAHTVQQLQSPLNLFLDGVRSLIKSDRLIFYQFHQDWSGTIIAESVARDFPKSLGAEIKDPCFAEKYLDKYRRGRIQATRNIYEAGLTECHIKQLEAFEVKSNLVIPVLIKTKIEPEKSELIGLLIAHQCSNPRIWNDFEIEYLKDVAVQLGLALSGYGSYKQVLERQEIFQQKIHDFIEQNRQLTQGKLTLNSVIDFPGLEPLNNFLQETVTSIADRLNNLKNVTGKINYSFTPEKKELALLEQQLVEQLSSIQQISRDIQPLAKHIQIVSHNLDKTSVIAKSATLQSKKAQENLKINSESIDKLQKNTINSIEKVKDIERISLEIIGSVPIFKKVMLQTKLLLKDIENNKSNNLDNFTKNIKKIAGQLNAIITEIEKIGENLQRKTSNVVRTMEIDFTQTSQIVPTIESSCENISKISHESRAMEQVIQLTNNSNKVQIEVLQKILNSLFKLSQLSAQSLSQFQQVSASLKATEKTVEKLAKSVEDFK